MSNAPIVEQIYQRLRVVCKDPKKQYPLHEPLLEGNAERYLSECIETNWVSSAGPFVDKFERNLEEFTGIGNAVAVSNGTAALHLCLRLLEVKAQDEVLVPTVTFIATVNSISYCDAVPHFVDVECSSLGIDPQKLHTYLNAIGEKRNGELFNRKTKRRIPALMLVHIFGLPAQLEGVQEVCKEFNIRLIEDAAEGLGTHYRGQHVGGFGDISALSFNGNKIITTGGGGAILTRHEHYAKRARHLSTTARTPHTWRYFHDEVGFNYRMPNINAAVGVAQLEKISELLTRKRKLHAHYQKLFADTSGVTLMSEPAYGKSNCWLNALILSSEQASQRDSILDYTCSKGIMTRPLWSLLHTLPMYKDCPKMDLSAAIGMDTRILTIPSSAQLSPV